MPKDFETADNFKLGSWVNQKRVAKSRGKLGEEQIKRLDDLGFVWDVYDHKWEQGATRLQDYKKEHQNAVVPRDYEASDGFKLGGWVARQRAAHSRGILTKEQIQRLEDLGLKWGNSRPRLLENGVETGGGFGGRSTAHVCALGILVIDFREAGILQEKSDVYFA